MSGKQKSPPLYSWIPAPLGWHLRGRHGRKLAHVWPGQAGTWWGTRLSKEGFADGSPLRFAGADAALEHFRELLAPKEGGEK